MKRRLPRIAPVNKIEDNYRKICATCQHHVGGIVKNNYVECHCQPRMMYLKKPVGIPILEDKENTCRFWMFSEHLRRQNEIQNRIKQNLELYPEKSNA